MHRKQGLVPIKGCKHFCTVLVALLKGAHQLHTGTTGMLYDELQVAARSLCSCLSQLTASTLLIQAHLQLQTGMPGAS